MKKRLRCLKNEIVKKEIEGMRLASHDKNNSESIPQDDENEKSINMEPCH